jgi:L-Ala-D/L-Glu epimerase
LKTGSQAIIKLHAAVERWPVAGAFVIARGAKTYVDVIVVTARDDRYRGQGEATPVYYRGEDAQNCLAQIARLPDLIDRRSLQTLLPPGAARNAVDCALWALEAQREGAPLWQIAGLPPPHPLLTAMTVSLGTPDATEAQARRLADQFSLLKLKLNGVDDQLRVAAARRGAPQARLIADANEAWTEDDIVAAARAMAGLGVEMIEQPFAVADDVRLKGLELALPIIADESCHSGDDLDRLVDRYQGINIKLDKCGGLTEALALRSGARERGLKIMVGCMLSTSLGIAPAFLVAQGADWVDLDGPLLLARDRSDAFGFGGGVMTPPDSLV